MVATLKQKTTWLGLLGILTAFSLLPFDDTTSMYVATILSSLGGMVGVLLTCGCGKKSSKKKKGSKGPLLAKFDDSKDDPTEIIER